MPGRFINTGTIPGGNLKVTNTNNSGNLSISRSPRPILSLDAGNPASYPGSGTTWTDLIGGRTFTLYNGPSYSAGFGGILNFNAASEQYAECSLSLPSQEIWSVGVWTYYTGNNTGTGNCIVTEVYPSITNQINFSLGDNLGVTHNPSSGFFDGAWRTSGEYALTSNSWYYIVGTYDGYTNSLYVNGTLVASDNYIGTPISGGSGIRLMRRWDDTDYWDGLLATVDIYDGALSATRISSTFNAQKSRYGL